MKAARFDALIFDMDGVLLDTRRSFTAAVLLAAGSCAAAGGLGDGWGEAEVERLRLCGGFNNDWDAAAALALLGPAAGPGEGWSVTCSRLAALKGGPAAVQALAGETAWVAARAAVLPTFQRLYAGPRSGEVYGIPPTQARGLYELEVPLATPAELAAAGLPFGIFTGRTREEAGLGLERLGLALPAERVVCDTAPRYRKPSPDGLLELASTLGARRVLHVGDTLDDLRSSLNARGERLDVAFAGIAPAGSDRERRFRDEGALVVRDGVRQVLLELVSGGPATWPAGERRLR